MILNTLIKTERFFYAMKVMYTELEKCQKSLEGYLEQKRNKFPRFYFVSNPGEATISSHLQKYPLLLRTTYWYNIRDRFSL